MIEIERAVMFYDTDAGGVVSNIAYLRFVEDARTVLLNTLGFPLAEIAARREFPAVLRTEIDYRKPAVLGDVIRVTARVEEVGRLRFWCGFELSRLSGGDVLATCRQRVAFLRMPEGGVLPVPESIRAEGA